MKTTRRSSATDNTMIYKGYTAGIEYRAKDNCLVGHIWGMRDIVGFHGDSVARIRAAFEEAVDDYIEACAKAGKEPNKPYSGNLTIRLDPALHARLASQARIAGKSLSNFVAEILTEFSAHH